jgi:DNA-binding MarR family transcriptional regulator
MDANDPAWEFWFTVRKAAAILERQMEAIITPELGITLGQFMVLSAIDAYPGRLNQTAIADHLGLTKGTVSRLVESGANRGWITVTPDPSSRRSRLVGLTPDGTSLVRQGDQVLESAPLASYPGTNPSGATATVAMLQGFINAARGSS